jgi:hypothetical protein
MMVGICTARPDLDSLPHAILFLSYTGRQVTIFSQALRSNFRLQVHACFYVFKLVNMRHILWHNGPISPFVWPESHGDC